MRTLLFDRQHRSIILLLSATTVVAFPHVFHLAWPFTAFFLFAICWRFLAIGQPNILPGRKTLLALTGFAVALIFLKNHSVMGRDAGTSAVLVALALKLMELKSTRDHYVLVFLAFFVALTQFLFNQSVSMTAFILAVSWLLVSTLISMNGQSLKSATLFKMGGSLILQAIPVMVFLFVFFPRITTPQFGLHDEDQQAVSGLSSVLEPGKISQLSMSREIAFRVTFSGEIPPPKHRYWRGPVFWKNEGRRWTLPEQKPSQSGNIRFYGKPFHYSIVLEPHQQKWLFALDLPRTLPANAYQTNELVLLSKTIIKKRLAYKLASNTVYNSGQLSKLDLARGLQLTIPPSRRVSKLLDSWKSGNSRPEIIVQKSLAYYHNEPFVYSLTPPRLGDNPVEEFLFETQKGFCEHYATSFVYLMRVAGIPARVVTGYQGGEFNAIGNFLEVRQADAHAWAEVWFKDKGWVRIDPTAAVAPERVEQGFDVNRQIATGLISFAVAESSLVAKWLKNSRQLWASLDHSWNRWVVSYDVRRQNLLLDLLGIDSIIKKVLLLLLIFASAICLLTIFLFRKKQTKKDEVVALYEKFCRKLARGKLLKKPTEGARDFGFRAAATYPEQKSEIDEITQTYLRLRYEKNSAPDDLSKIKGLVRHFQPKLKRVKTRHL